MSAPTPGAADPLSLRGVVPPTVTAFDDDGVLDAETTAAHARFVVDRGVHGVFPLGTNGEFALLGPEERDAVVRAVVDEVGDEVPVIAGVGEPATHQTVERATAAEAAGADGVVVVTPYYYPLDGDAAVEHYRTVCAAVDCPVYVYHIPSKTGNDLSLETLDDIAAIDNLAGLKDSSKDVPWLGQAVAAHDDLTFLAGSDSLLKPGLDLGCTGMVSAVANVFPELVVDLYDAYDAGKTERAADLQEQVYEVRSAIKRGPYMAGVKEALSIRGFDAGPLRSPLRRMDDEAGEALRADLASLGLVE
ncbi:dihydrodipicolinate synthase family protein [Halolamina sp. CBA1230]|uniref:dihydrodipicolinate synthase family protein n=1 Tax=Halolamina sp. CBA1230 TaxID=1853690 RepID=UPI0009A2321F|nr:dihydrodipicolinate synthase family protein [Halolamina sp. CBA1230]QKY21468.1 dihydrodipicolinate synthase family protein [Halolamina sp. CBA1230]